MSQALPRSTLSEASAASGAPGRVIALAGSAGALATFLEVLSHLPADFPAPILVVQHLNPQAHSWMPEILARRSPLAVKQAVHGERLLPGTVYIAPPDHHLLVGSDGTVELTHTARVRYVRPAADPLFCSLAASFGARAVAVVLSGTGEDGAEGVRAIRRCGGTVIAQAGAPFPGMPEAAIRTGAADRVLAAVDIAGALRELAAGGSL